MGKWDQKEAAHGLLKKSYYTPFTTLLVAPTHHPLPGVGNARLEFPPNYILFNLINTKCTALHVSGLPVISLDLPLKVSAVKEIKRKG